LCALSACAAVAQEEGFVSLMTVKTGDTWTENGKPLNGWVKYGGEATFEAKDGEIIGRRGPGGNTFLCTEKNYADFILRFEFKYDIGCNSGMQFRSNVNAKGTVFGYQCEIDDGVMTGLTGLIYDESRRNRWLRQPTGETKRRITEATKKDDWNEMAVQCVGPSLKTWLNGVLIDSLIDTETREGFFGLQVHGGPQGQLRFRNIRVKELPPATLSIGTGRADITPPKRVPLLGQFDLRMSKGVETPLTANAVALESAGGNGQRDATVFVSVDVCLITDDLLDAVRKKVAERDASIATDKLVLNSTHTHTAPTLTLDNPKLPVADDIMDYPDVIDFTAGRIADAVAEAWKSRKPGKMAFGLDFGVVGWNRRATYANGSSRMYGNTNQEDFRGLEAMEDYDIGSIFFLDENDKMLAVILNVACPSQVVEMRSHINADYWHPVRETLKKRFGDDLTVLGWCSVAGDIAPRPIYRKAAVDRMNALRKLDEMQEIARKIDRAVADTWEAVQATATDGMPLEHRAETLQLPMRKVTEQEYQTAKVEYGKAQAAVKANPNKAPAEVDWMSGGWHGSVIKRYEAQQADPDTRCPATIHVVRLGPVAIFTNPFEMFTDYGAQMKARSPALQTFLIQLTDRSTLGSYLATERAVRGGHYSAVIQSVSVGPDGGQVLVNETLRLAGELFPQ